VPEELFLRAPAKINLALRVLFRREDGYHELYTIFQKITLFDELFLFPSRKIELEILGEIEVPEGEDNLCYQAALLFFQESRKACGIKIRLLKRIPAGAGLGGGSSDAAAVLLGLNRLWPVFTLEELLLLGKRLGADVPFFISPHSAALARGIGEILSPWPSYPAWYLVLCPEIKISTAWAYANLRLTTRREPPNYEPDQPLWEQGLVNDFEPVIFDHYPVLKELKEELLRAGAQAALLSGSGAALFGVFSTREEAQRAGRIFRKKGLRAEIVTNYSA